MENDDGFLLRAEEAGRAAGTDNVDCLPQRLVIRCGSCRQRAGSHPPGRAVGEAVDEEQHVARLHVDLDRTDHPALQKKVANELAAGMVV